MWRWLARALARLKSDQSSEPAATPARTSPGATFFGKWSPDPYLRREFVDFPAEATEVPDGFRSEVGIRFRDASRLRRIGNCEAAGRFIAYRCHSLTEVHPSAARRGLTLQEASALEALPDGLQVNGDLRLTNCPKLAALPNGLVVSGSVILRGCPRLASIPDDLRIQGNLLIVGRTRLRTLPPQMQVIGDVVLQNAVAELPAGLLIRGSLGLIECLRLNELPAGMRIGADLIIRRCPRLLRLPAHLSIEGGLEARFGGFTGLPEDIQVGTYVDLQGCTQLTSLPAGLHVPGALRLRRCVRLEGLPHRLRVGGSSLTLRGPRSMLQSELLDLENCIRVSELPTDLEVAGAVEIAGTSIKSLPPGLEVQLQWRGVAVPPRVVFEPESYSASEILNMENLEVRRTLLELRRPERLLEELGAQVLDEDTDPGGPRRLLSVRIPTGNEAVHILECRCPSTRRTYHLRVPPHVFRCRAAAAWAAGFDDPDEYRPLLET